VTFPKDVFIVAVGQIVPAQRRETALHNGGAARPEKHDIFADGIELLAVSGVETFTQADQQEQGSDAPGDSEYSQERAQFVRPESAECLAEDVEDVARFIWISFSTSIIGSILRLARFSSLHRLPLAAARLI
jgi:hypothetical protein